MNRKILLKGLIVFLIFICLLIIVFLVRNSDSKRFNSQKVNLKIQPAISTAKVPSHTVPPTIPLTPPATVVPTKPLPKIIFGIGSQAGPAMDYRLVQEAPVRMLTSWYNGTKDLEWMQVQKNDLIPRLYAKGYIVHLITWTDLPQQTI